MNKLVATLTTTTVLFAGSTVYFAYRANEAAAGAPSAAAGATTADPATHTNPMEDLSGGKTSAAAINPSPTRTATTSPASVVSASAPARAMDHQRETMLPFAKDFLRQYDDVSRRDNLLKSVRPGIESQFTRLKDKLKLDNAKFAKIVDLLAEEQLEAQANYFRCTVDPACEPSSVRPARDHSDELLALLGDEGYAQLMAYRKAMPEWQSIVQLRGRLSEANNLSDSNADRLLESLSAERERYMAESNQAGVKTSGWGNGTGMIWYAADGGVAEQIASATQYAERMRTRAAGVLTSEQLRSFVAIQDEMLAGLASYLHSQNGG